MNFPLLDIFWTMLWFFLWVVWIFLLFRVITDVFRSKDLSGVSKAVWTLALVVVPLLGVLVYLIARGADLHERETVRSEAGEQALRQYLTSMGATPAGASVGEELTRLSASRESGVLTDDEFSTQKAKLLA